MNFNILSTSDIQSILFGICFLAFFVLLIFIIVCFSVVSASSSLKKIYDLLLKISNNDKEN